MKRKKVTLRTREEMLKRLLEVNKSRLMKDLFYPNFLEQAGKEKNELEIFVMLMNAASNYSKNFPASDFRSVLPQARNFIAALVDDPEIEKVLKGIIQATLAPETQKGT